MLGLVVLAWGLFVAPLLHRETHVHGVAHSHGSAPVKQAPHGAGSLEHQDLAMASAPVVAQPVVVMVTVAMGRELAPASPSLAGVRRVEMAQAP